MALIRCPECGNSISDRAEKCPHCGLPASYFSFLSKNTPHMKEAGLDYKNLQNVLISFERDHAQLFRQNTIFRTEMRRGCGIHMENTTRS